MSWSYCADLSQTTGFLSDSDTKSFMKSLGKPPRIVRELVEARAWDVVEGGYAIHEFEQGLPEKSTARVRAWREKKRLQAVSGVAVATVPETLRNEASRARGPVPVPDVVTPDVVTTPEPVPVPEPFNASTQTTPAEATTPADAISNGPLVELVNGMQVILGHGLSPVDVITCQGALNQYAYMSAASLVQRASQHITHCQSQVPPLPIPRTVAGFSDTWRSQNDFLADHGSPKAWRPGRTGQMGMAGIKDTLHEVAPRRAADPKEATPK